MFKIIYTTNLEDRIEIKVAGKSRTDAYLTFIREHPIHYIIVEMEEII